jgi:SAM-dependent methyltransferase
MDTQLRNMLYERPELYESVYHGSDHAVPRMCERLFKRHLDGWPASLLDIGCGTGRDLAYLAARCPDCIGIDYQEGMIAYARRQRPQIDFRVGDMTSLRLGRTFEAITCFGYAIANLHSNDDIARAIATFAAHAAPGTLLILDAINATREPGAGTLPRRFVIDTPGFKATAAASYEDDRRRQLLVRRREWIVAGEGSVHDFVKFRTLAPLELEHHLAVHGFQTLGIYDNHDLVATDLGGSNLFAVARFAGGA